MKAEPIKNNNISEYKAKKGTNSKFLYQKKYFPKLDKSEEHYHQIVSKRESNETVSRTLLEKVRTTLAVINFLKHL